MTAGDTPRLPKGLAWRLMMRAQELPEDMPIYVYSFANVELARFGLEPTKELVLSYYHDWQVWEKKHKIEQMTPRQWKRLLRKEGLPANFPKDFYYVTKKEAEDRNLRDLTQTYMYKSWLQKVQGN